MNELEALKQCLEAMKRSRRLGCTEHLDACDDGGKSWHDAVKTGEAAVENAAIPALLESLKAIVVAICTADDHYSDLEEVKSANAAIAKAEGGAK